MKKIKKIILSFFSFVLLMFSSLTLYSCGKGESRIYFANYESYMSPYVMDEMRMKYNIDFKSFKTNEELLREFELNYDIGVSSTYAVVELIKKDKVEKLDWTKFNLVNEIGLKIKNAEEALDLFIKEIHGILKMNDLNGDGIIGTPEDNLLLYSVPYFFQDFILGFKEKKITFDKNSYANWEEVFIEIKNKEIKRAISIDDNRTLFSLGKLVNDSNNNVNPNINENTINNFDKIYRFLPNFFKKNQIIFNSDSGIVLNDLSNPNGSELGFMYNGDVLYAMQGGDSGYNEPINFIRPSSGSNLALDMMIINKNSKRDKEILYKIINDIGLKGSTGPIDENSIVYKNFDYVQYTSPIRNIYEYVIDPNGYFYNKNDPSGEIAKKLINVFKINQTNPKRIETSINDIQKSNMLISYLYTKSKI